MNLRRPCPLLPALAFTAALLLALLPTLGRLYRGLDTNTPGPQWEALCTTQGLVLRWVDATGSTDAPSKGAPTPHAADDCPYCPLLATVEPPSLIAPGWAALAPARAHAPRTSATLSDKPRVSGWSPRGPPLLRRA